MRSAYRRALLERGGLDNGPCIQLFVHLAARREVASRSSCASMRAMWDAAADFEEKITDFDAALELIGQLEGRIVAEKLLRSPDPRTLYRPVS